MDVQTLEDMFVYQLQKMYYVEDRLVELLGELASDATNDKLQEGFEEHRNETREHVQRLERAFRAMGEEPEMKESRMLEALVEERDQFREAATSAEMRDLFDIQAGMKTERIEMSGYEGLLTLAVKLDYDDDVTEPLQDNLSSERSTFHELQGLSQGSKLKSMVGKILS